MKADAERDLYADLEIKPTADANEIKRQFKKLALKYHPDRNPGKEVEYNSKFQAIQSANEILTDPHERAKYDAARMRAGLLYTYTNASSPPSKPNVPPRPTATGFPPPPRPPPAPAPKSQFPPPPSGAQKYARFSRPESTWGSAGSDDVKARTNEYKAWEQMRHGQGPLPKRTGPPKVPRSATFQPGREPNGGVPRNSSRGRSDWDRFQEGQPGMPRANTSRVSPKRSGFAPRTPGEDERQAPSAYFNVSRGERPPGSRAQTSMPPPPSPVPTAKKPDSSQAHRDNRDNVPLNEPFGNKSRMSTPYKTSGGERTFFANPGIHRSATSADPKDRKHPTGTYEAPHVRAAAAASSNYNGKSSPERAKPNLAGMYYSSSSSSSSEDDEPKARPTQVPKSRRGRMPAGAHQPTRFNLYATAEDAGDEQMAPQAGLGSGYYTGPRRHSAIDLDSQKPSDFHDRQVKHDGEKSQPQFSDVPSGVSETSQADGSRPSLSRSKSWQEKCERHKEKWGSPPRDKDYRPATDDQDRTPIFHMPDYSNEPSAGASAFRSRSTENIDTNFSPSGYHPKFFESSPSRTGTPLRTVSPAEGNPPRKQQEANGNAQDVRNGSSKFYGVNVPPSPPPVAGSYYTEKWAAHLENINFEMQPPPPGRSGSRTTRKRHKTHGSKPTNSQAPNNSAEEDVATNSNTGESLDNSKDNSDVDPMDLDEPSPPISSARTAQQQTNGTGTSPTRANPIGSTPRQGPSLPPRRTGEGQGQPTADTAHFNLGELKETFPFAPSKEGLGNMSEMGTNLPFESRPSPTKPAAHSSVSRHGLPNPPKFPETPRNVTPSTCESYLRQLRSYMGAWNTFNSDMITALAKRQAFIQDGSNCNWLDVKGTGYEDYMKGLGEHKTARVHWEAAFEKHEECMRDLGYVRDEIIRGRGGAGRRPSNVADMLAGLL